MKTKRFLRYFLLSVLLLGSGSIALDRLRQPVAAPISPLRARFSGREVILWPMQNPFPLRENSSAFSGLTKPKPFRVPVLLYHYVEVVTDERDTLRKSMSVNPVTFENQLIALKAAGYHFLKPADFTRALTNEIELPEKSVVLTFDDGYRDFYTVVYPVLKRQNVTAINYLVADFIGKNVNYMTEAQIKEIVADGLVGIGSHTLEHPDLTLLSPDKAKTEITESKSRLEQRFGVKIDDFAYPGGYNNEAVQKLVKEAGYLTAVATQLGVTDEKANLFHLPRVRVGGLPGSEIVGYLEKKLK